MTPRRCFALIALAVVLGARPAEAQCTYSVSPTNVSVPSTGSNASILVITGSSCAWTATSAVGWITVTSGASMSGLGSSNYTVAPNTTGAVRTGTLTVAGQTVTITQSANSCTYNVSPTSVSAPSTGSNASVSVTTGSSCAWTATSMVAWITITSGASMAGLGSTNYTVAVNPTGSVRTGTLIVAGQTVTITQAATAGCSVHGDAGHHLRRFDRRQRERGGVDRRSLRLDRRHDGDLDHHHFGRVDDGAGNGELRSHPKPHRSGTHSNAHDCRPHRDDYSGSGATTRHPHRLPHSRSVTLT